MDTISHIITWYFPAFFNNNSRTSYFSANSLYFLLLFSSIDQNLPFDFLLLLPKKDPISILPEIVRIMMLRQFPYLLSNSSFTCAHFMISDYLPLSLYHHFPSFSFISSYSSLSSYHNEWKQDEEDCNWRLSLAVECLSSSLMQ